MISEILASIDRRARSILVPLSPVLATRLYSGSRQLFLRVLSSEQPRAFKPPTNEQKVLWGIPFRSGLYNAAGMFKNGVGYELSFAQGAGAFLAGTTTALARSGNNKIGISHPFLPYIRSAAASNWLGLPNEGHAAVAQRLSMVKRHNGFPVGASLMMTPGIEGKIGLQELVGGMRLYEQAGVDFIEINESCPNVKHADTSLQALAGRLEYIADEILRRRTRILPVIVKFSMDTRNDDLPTLLDLLFRLGFDGINIGNTSTDYKQAELLIHPTERRAFRWFTQTFGGGVSGRPLQQRSLELATFAVQYIRQNQPTQEFHVIRTGGIMNATDLRLSLESGISLCQWYTGYFEQFARYGHNVYQQMYP